MLTDRILEISETVHDETRIADLRRSQAVTHAKAVLANMERHEILGEIQALKLDRATLAETFLERAETKQIEEFLEHWAE